MRSRDRALQCSAGRHGRSDDSVPRAIAPPGRDTRRRRRDDQAHAAGGWMRPLPASRRDRRSERVLAPLGVVFGRFRRRLLQLVRVPNVSRHPDPLEGPAGDSPRRCPSPKPADTGIGFSADGRCRALTSGCAACSVSDRVLVRRHPCPRFASGCPPGSVECAGAGSQPG